MNYDIDALLQELKEKREEIEKDKEESEKMLEDALNVNPSTDLGVTAILDSLKDTVEPNSDVKEVSAAVVETKQLDFSFNKADKLKEIVEKRISETVDSADATDDIDSGKGSETDNSFGSLLRDYTGEFHLGHLDETDVSPENVSRVDTEKHPLFSAQQTTVKITIPEVIPESKDYTVDEATGKIELEEKASSKTLLGSSDDDDDFSEFFGDSVIVEHSDTKYRTRKIEVSEETTNEGDASDDKQPTDAFEVISQEHGKKGRTVVIVGVAAFLCLFFNLLVDVFHIQVFTSPKTYYGILFALIVLSVVADWGEFVKNFKNIFKIRFKAGTLLTLSLIISAIDVLVGLINASSVETGSIALVSILGYFFYYLGVFLDSKRVYDSAKMISEMPQKYASLVLADSDFTHALTHDLNVTTSNVLIKRKTGVIDNILSHAYSKTVICCFTFFVAWNNLLFPAWS